MVMVDYSRVSCSRQKNFTGSRYGTETFLSLDFKTVHLFGVLGSTYFLILKKSGRNTGGTNVLITWSEIKSKLTTRIISSWVTFGITLSSTLENLSENFIKNLENENLTIGLPQIT